MKRSDWFAISEYDAIFTALGGEYKAKQNRWRKLSVLPKFQSKNSLKIQEYLVLMILKVRKDYMAFEKRDLLWSELL